MRKLLLLLALLIMPALAYAQSGGVRVFPSGAASVTGSSTTTFTNKTLDCEATGNTCTITAKIYLPAAGGTVAAPTSFLDLPASNPAVAAVIAGTNTLQGVLDFADGASELSAQTNFMLPDDFTGTMDARLKWFTSATTGDVVWKVYTSCVADAETNDPSWNTASTVTDTAKGTANQTNDASIAGVDITGCAAGELMHVKIGRDPANASDTLAGTARLIGITLTIRRAI